MDESSCVARAETTLLGSDGAGVLAFLDLQDQDTAIKKRNRNAQRNHRERKRGAAAAAATATGAATGQQQTTVSRDAEGKKSPLRAGARDGARQNHDQQAQGNNYRLFDMLTTTNPMPFGGNDAPQMELPDALGESWSHMKDDRPGMIEYTAQPSAVLPYPSHPDQTFESFFNYCHSSDGLEAPWMQGQNGPMDIMKNLNGSNSGFPQSPSGRAAENGDDGDYSMDLDGGNPPAKGQRSRASQRRFSDQSSSSENHSEAQILDRRFEAILDAVDSAGYHSFDDMAIAYYTTALSEKSSLRTTQKFSRERQLNTFLKSLKQSAKEWSARETWAYQEEILDSAQDILSHELSKFVERKLQQTPDESAQSSASSQTSCENSLSPILKGVEGLLQDVEVNRLLKMEMRSLRESVPDAFAMLAKLAQNANVSQPLNSRIVAVFLHLLVQGDPSI